MNPEDYKDPIIAGRRQAQRAFPITKGMTCEWAGLQYAGGGKVPIIGCPGYAAVDLHHGPDKNTFRNVEGNIHRICSRCHNRWHALNDVYYGERPPAHLPFLPMDGDFKEHDAVTRASDEDVMAEDLRRRKEAREHGRDPGNFDRAERRGNWSTEPAGELPGDSGPGA